jgi:succinate dehydrogenase/fumarate reductase iron-sulfur protein
LIRDLVVDMAPFRTTMESVGAAFTPGDGAPTFAPVAGDGKERAQIDHAIECIGCGMCVSACTMVAHDPHFPGPAALNRIFTLELDSRDAGAGGRAALLSSEDTLFRCHTQANCTAVCPMDISPTTSIMALRRLTVARLFR